jgi:hypothetical protein
MEGFSDHEWDVICSYSELVFARTTPEQKLRIVHGKFFGEVGYLKVFDGFTYKLFKC